MVEAGAAPQKSRAEIFEELKQLSDEYWSHWDTAEVGIDETDTTGYVAKGFYDDNGIGTVLIKWKCEGLTMEQWATWEEDPTIVSEKI